MATQADVAAATSPAGGTLKPLRDVMSILEMKLILMRRGWCWYLLSSLVFPVGMFYWGKGMTPDDPDAVRSVMVGSIVFAVSMATVSTLAQQMIQDRFQGRWKLLITMPMSKAAYAIGVMSFATLLSAGTVIMLLAFAWMAVID